MKNAEVTNTNDAQKNTGRCKVLSLRSTTTSKSTIPVRRSPRVAQAFQPVLTGPCATVQTSQSTGTNEQPGDRSPVCGAHGRSCAKDGTNSPDPDPSGGAPAVLQSVRDLPIEPDFITTLPAEAIERHADQDRVYGPESDTNPLFVRACNHLREGGVLSVRVGIVDEAPDTVTAYADWDVVRAHKVEGRSGIVAHVTRFSSHEALTAAFYVHAGPSVRTEWHWCVYAHDRLRQEQDKALARKRAGTRGPDLESGEAREIVGREMGRNKDTVVKMHALVELAHWQTPSKAAESEIAKQLSRAGASALAVWRAHHAQTPTHLLVGPVVSTMVNAPSLTEPAAVERAAFNDALPTAETGLESTERSAGDTAPACPAIAPELPSAQSRKRAPRMSASKKKSERERLHAEEAKKLTEIASGLKKSLAKLNTLLAQDRSGRALRAAVRVLVTTLDGVTREHARLRGHAPSPTSATEHERTAA